MIARLRGELLEAEGGRVVVDAGGVGYEAQVPESVMVQLPSIGEPVDLFVRQVVREDSVALYGFLDPFQRRLFDLLREVKGCGPKTGLALLGDLGEEAVVNGIATQDARLLARASGVGPRLAERLILELKDKIQEEILHQKISGNLRAAVRVRPTPPDDLLEALLALGYRRAEAEAACATAREDANDIEDQLKAALQVLKR